MKNNNQTIGILLITGAIALLIPYTMLTIIFEYPGILRQDTGTILTKFYQGGNSLVWTWFAFAITGIPLLPAYIMIGQIFENQAPLVRMATTIGVIGLIVQMIGLLRWTFVVPVLADTFVHAADEATKAAAIVSFKTIHQFGGVILGEHLGQLFTIAWTVMMTISFDKLKLMPKWVNWLGITSAIIYMLAQAELFATVIKDFPVWDMAGFIGSTLWLIWLIIVGFMFIKRRNQNL
ncbi:MAG: DUF4386 domain-containing protein [Saprospiraceae bacterium]|uniref:DUF4386 domain-containing protein n=1 Tax=Candidatus Opimibacter skivensis TaxID=2982028 RepID=A0A9D7SPV0_9BACT|nr:DUF4386 domain-containing protein [Candidatus Opimibacter skivensis]